MCGITGIISNDDIDTDVIKKMAHLIEHRGSDGKGFYTDDRIALANTRLAIIDIEDGDQPMVSENGTVIVFNGEIYNFIELREMLVAKGVRFSTNSDTEVVLKLYETYGERSFSMLNGMFAICIYDHRKLYLVRDRSGIKPLYFTIVRDGDRKTLIFGSEIKTILATGYERKLSKIGFHQFLNLRFTSSTETMFEGIHKLDTGTMLVWDEEYIELVKFWEVRPNNRINTIDQATMQLETLLPKAIKRHMIADVEVGSYLSGGIDSSTIVHYASQFSDHDLKTFTLGFGQKNDETKKARKIADHYGTDHRELIIPRKFMDDAPEILWHSEFPKRNLYPYYLAEMASKDVKVVLSGLGSDELFCGYLWKYDYLKRYNSKPKYEIYTDKISLDPVFTKEEIDRWYGESLNIDENISQEFKSYFDTSLNPLRSLQVADYQSKMVNDFLHVDDVTSMAHSLESRTPFLDNTLINFAFSVPVDLHIQDRGKNILRRVMADKLPKWSTKVPKHGFTISMTDEYKNNILDYADMLLSDGHTIGQGLLDQSFFSDRTRLMDSLNIYTIWNLLYFEVWYEMFIEREVLEKPTKKFSEFI